MKVQPGDVVRIDSNHDSLIPVGSRAVVDGSHFGMDFDDGVGPMVLTVANLYGGAAFRGPNSKHDSDQSEKVSCSGGPCPFIPMGELVYEGETEQRFWRWKSTPQKDGGEEYTRTVNLWSWKGKQP